ncbi:MAG TPA: NAD(P)H-binding protein [Candidatus Sulfotelmatobacter sp.]|nr:NAD(P)H-binding protein [Candidatus Sulfotelmatobacter sp.]
MKILVLGPNGAVGQIVIDDLLKANHQVTALVRNPTTIQKKHPRLTVLQGTPTDAEDLETALGGQDAVMSTLGVRKNKKTTVRTDVVRNLVAGMKKHGVRRLVWLDGAGVGSSKEFVQRSSFFFGRIVMPLLLNHMYKDAAVADALIQKSGCDWVIVRPMSFTNGTKTGNITVVTDMSLPVKLRLRIARADVAAFLVEQLTRDDYVGQMPIIYS